MDADQAIRAFAAAKDKLPVEAIQWCRANRDAATPRLLHVLEGYADGTDRSRRARDALFFILHLFGERGEPRCVEPLCRLARDTTAINEVLGDGVTESFAAILAASYDGDPAPLKALIEAPEADELARGEAFDALGYLAATGRIPLDATEGYLREVHGRLLPQDESWVWYSWAQVIALLRLDSLLPLVDDAFARELIPAYIIGDKENYDELRAAARADPDPVVSFERECIQPYDDMIATLSTWAGFRQSTDRSDDLGPVETVDQAVVAFARAAKELPFGAMLWCRDNWDAAAPALIRIIERYADRTDRSTDAARAGLFILHLAAERRDSRAIAPLCRLARDRDAIEAILGDDGIPESLPSILVSVFGGDATPIKTLIEAPDADEYVRSAALQALGYLAATDRIPLPATLEYLRTLYDTLEPQAASHVWWGWAETATLLHLDGAAERIDGLFARGLLSDDYGMLDDFRTLLEEASKDPSPRVSVERERPGPIEDAIDALSQWASFREDEDDWDDDLEPTDEDLARWAREPEPPAVNPFKNVGRNDPCPCGSGKKFKKCCLGLTPG